MKNYVQYIIEILNYFISNESIYSELISENIYISNTGTIKIDVVRNFLNDIKNQKSEENTINVVYSIGILILQMYSKKQFDYILEFKSKILDKMKESADNFIQKMYVICDSCFESDPNKRISLKEILKRIQFAIVFEDEDEKFQLKMFNMWESTIPRFLSIQRKDLNSINLIILFRQIIIERTIGIHIKRIRSQYII